MRPSILRLPGAALVAACLLLVPTACEPDPAPGPETDAAPPGGDPAGERAPGRVFERDVVFLTTRADSAIIVPWITTARTWSAAGTRAGNDAEPGEVGGVERRVRGYLDRGGTWERFFEDAWETGPTRAPWRLLPRGSMRLVVGAEDALEQIVFEEGPRQLDVILETPLVEWSDQRGSTFRVLEGALVLSSQRVPGLVLDMARSRGAEEPPAGSWAFLASGDSLQMVLDRPESGPAGTPDAWRGWARLSFPPPRGGERSWMEITVDWPERRTFEQARRDVPAAWTLQSSDGRLAGELDVVGADIRAEPGTGPQRPVRALFEVAGTVSIQGVEYPVHGLLRHVQE